MTQKRILRANAPKVVRERGLVVRDVFRMYAKDPDDPAIATVISELVEGDPTATATAFFDIANQLVIELSDATGSKPEDVVNRVVRG